MEILPQIIVFAIIASAIYALLATGLTLTFSTLDFINFAHGDMAMLGAFFFFSLYISQGLPLTVALILTILIAAALGLFIERTTFRPVRDKKSFIPLVLSIGVAILAQSLITMFYGGGSQNYYKGGGSATVYNLFNGQITITLGQIMIVVSAVVLLSGLYLFLKNTRTGKAIRAVSDNKEIAAIMGIDVNKTIMILFAIATTLAAVAGLLVAFDQNLYPYMGLSLSIKVFAAIILGGVGKFRGAIVGAIIIGFSENLIVGLTGIKSSYKELIVFTIFIFVLMYKPYGIFGGQKEEVESR